MAPQPFIAQLPPVVSVPARAQPSKKQLLKSFSVYQGLKTTSGESFSCNIYSEISIENLKKEHEKVLFELFDYKFNESDPPLYKTSLEYRHAFRKVLLMKSDAMKKEIRKYIKEKGLRSLNDTNDDINTVFEAMKNEANYYRLKSIHCFDIMEHPTYQKT
jgi:hypothetical protein